MSACNRLDLQTLGFQPVMPKKIPDHWSRLEGASKLGPLTLISSQPEHCVGIETRTRIKIAV